MNVEVMYDAASGEVKDTQGFSLGFVLVGHSFPHVYKPEESGTKVSDLASLKGAGFTAEEIMQMKREGLV